MDARSDRDSNFSNSSYNSENYSNDRRNQKATEENPEDPPWKSPKNFLYDSSRDRPGEYRASRPPRRLQYNQHRLKKHLVFKNLTMKNMGILS